jgi:hypothetical protein
MRRMPTFTRPQKITFQMRTAGRQLPDRCKNGSTDEASLAANSVAGCSLDVSTGWSWDISKPIDKIAIAIAATYRSFMAMGPPSPHAR